MAETVSRTENGCVPDLPSSFMYDLFLGSNAKQIIGGPYGELGHFDGLIDDLRIYSTFGRVPDDLPSPVMVSPGSSHWHMPRPKMDRVE